MGLLDEFMGFAKTPEGQGLLSGVAGWAAGARKGTPWNNLGRGGIAGLTGYAGAEDRISSQAQKDMALKLSQMQYNKLKTDVDTESAMAQAWQGAFTGQPSAGVVANLTPTQPPTSVMFQGGTARDAANSNLPSWAQLSEPKETPVKSQQGPGKLSDMYFAAASSAQNPMAAMKLYQQGQAALKDEKALGPKYQAGSGVDINPATGKLERWVSNDQTGRPEFVGVAPKPNMKSVNLGNRLQYINEDAIAPGTNFSIAQSPDSVASVGATIRGQNLTDARAKEQNAAPSFHDGSWVYKPTAQTPQGVSTKVAGFEKSGTPSEGERKAATLLRRMEGSLGQLNAAVAKDASVATPRGIGTAIEGTPLVGGYLGNLATRSGRQQVEAAQLDILDSALTLGTGAAYTKEQLEGYRKSYFPEAWDSDDTKKDKADRLANVIEAAKIAAGRAAPSDSSPAAKSPQESAGKIVPKSATLADIAATAKASGRTTAQVTAALKSQGYVIR